MAFQTSQAVLVCYAESKQRCPLKHIYVNSVYFTHHHLLSQICFSPQSLGLCQSHWDPGWTIDFSVKSVSGVIGPSQLLGSLGKTLWVLLPLFTKTEVLRALDFGTVGTFASWFPFHCRKQGEEEPSRCFSFKWSLEDLVSGAGVGVFVFFQVLSWLNLQTSNKCAKH